MMESSNPHSLPLPLVKPPRNVASSMVIRAFFSPTPRRSSTIPIITILRRAPDLKVLSSNFGMAEQPKPIEQTQIKSGANGEEENKNGDAEETVTTPPPPEKPLPDDCCGSGCVRCVWDVYYDELEEYNKLYHPHK